MKVFILSSDDSCNMGSMPMHRYCRARTVHFGFPIWTLT